MYVHIYVYMWKLLNCVIALIQMNIDKYMHARMEMQMDVCCMLLRSQIRNDI